MTLFNVIDRENLAVSLTVDSSSDGFYRTRSGSASHSGATQSSSVLIAVRVGDLLSLVSFKLATRQRC